MSQEQIKILAIILIDCGGLPYATNLLKLWSEIELPEIEAGGCLIICSWCHCDCQVKQGVQDNKLEAYVLDIEEGQLVR